MLEVEIVACDYEGRSMDIETQILRKRMECDD